uniref:Uncharacterized protein n=1 Tax=Anopheles minimus TaxID=112268 RepID=A0A182WJP1_9DIPT
MYNSTDADDLRAQLTVCWCVI